MTPEEEIESLITYSHEETYTRYSFGNRIFEELSNGTLMMPRNYYRVCNYDLVKERYVKIKFEQLSSGKKEPKYHDFQRLMIFRRFLNKVCLGVGDLNRQAKEKHETKQREKYANTDIEEIIKDLEKGSNPGKNSISFAALIPRL